ncbi:MAG: hypothetical protein RMX68_009745 [Aulosira sp. ZfuVER01]|nr:hypothetical protein [Aulosira sp. ZfuVER01]MDZ7998000.1 hypothetical protein [Aulosira sp. DedVER01a]MDZ8050394.1 hypothetical protein [Aulosira sp. ZfuCHP01]
MRKSQLIYTLLALSLVSILGFSYFNKRSQITACKPSQFIAAQGKQYLYPKKIVIQPWRGQHHVYGVFSVAKEYKTDNLVQVTLPDRITECGIVDPIDNSYSSGAYAQPGHYLVKGYLNTRIALWLIVLGKGNQLAQPNNWTLGYIKKEQK